jgi:plasmid stabilization system protein ParE
VTVEYHPAIESELLRVRRYYESKVPGLGVEFITEFEQHVLQIVATPERWRIIERDIRRVLMKRFPYVIYYRALPDRVRVTVIKHQRRHPSLGSFRD